MIYSRSPREIPRAKPEGSSEGSGYISSYIPTQVIIQTFSMTTQALSFLEINIERLDSPGAPTAGQYGKILHSRLSNTGGLNFNIMMFSNWECCKLQNILFYFSKVLSFSILQYSNIVK